MSVPLTTRRNPVTIALPGVAATTDAAIAELAALSATNFPSVNAALDSYIAFAMRLTGVRSAFIAHIHSGQMHVISAGDANGCGIRAGGVFPLETTFCQYVRASGMPVVVSDAATDPRVVRTSNARITIGAYMGVPLLFSNGTIFGTFCVLDPEARPFTQTQLNLLRIAAQHVTAHIERAVTTPPEAATATETANNAQALLKVVAHDIRNPLANMLGLLDMIRTEELGPVSAEQDDALGHVQRNVRLINRLTHDLLDAAAAETGAISLLNETIDAAAHARVVIDLFAPEAQQRGLTLTMHADECLHPLVCDADRLHQILLNLLGNAVRYTPAGNVTVHLSQHDAHIRFAVSDTGLGISKEDQARIWEAHVRSNQRGGGFGLGLHIVQRLVTAMGGSVGVTSEPGVGSTFWVLLPNAGPPPQRFVAA